MWRVAGIGSVLLTLLWGLGTARGELIIQTMGAGCRQITEFSHDAKGAVLELGLLIVSIGLVVRWARSELRTRRNQQSKSQEGDS